MGSLSGRSWCGNPVPPWMADDEDWRTAGSSETFVSIRIDSYKATTLSCVSKVVLTVRIQQRRYSLWEYNRGDIYSSHYLLISTVSIVIPPLCISLSWGTVIWTERIFPADFLLPGDESKREVNPVFITPCLRTPLLFRSLTILNLWCHNLKLTVSLNLRLKYLPLVGLMDLQNTVLWWEHLLRALENC